MSESEQTGFTPTEMPAATPPRARKPAAKKTAKKATPKKTPAAKPVAAKEAAPAPTKRGRPKGTARTKPAGRGGTSAMAIRAFTECKPEDAKALAAVHDIISGLSKKSRERVLSALGKVFG